VKTGKNKVKIVDLFDFVNKNSLLVNNYSLVVSAYILSNVKLVAKLCY